LGELGGFLGGFAVLETAIEAVRQVGQVLLEQFGMHQEIKSKGLRDIVTAADLAAQARAVEVIRSRFPDHDVWAEEAEQTPRDASDYCWIVDPLDGTTNYSSGYPCFSVSIGLSYRGEAMLGVVYDPLRDQLFQAQRHQGAYLNWLASTGLVSRICALRWPNW